MFRLTYPSRPRPLDGKPAGFSSKIDGCLIRVSAVIRCFVFPLPPLPLEQSCTFPANGGATPGAMMPQSYAVRPATARDELYGRIGKQVLYLFEYLASMPDALSTIPNRAMS